MKILTLLMAMSLLGNGFAMEKENKIETMNHSIHVEFDISSSALVVIDTIEFVMDNPKCKGGLLFSLNKNMEITSHNISLEEVKSQGNTSSYRSYRIGSCMTTWSEPLVISYRGTLADKKEQLLHPKHGPSPQTTGIIFQKGIYLSGTTGWIPRFEGSPLVTFQLTAQIEKQWNVVSQGIRVKDMVRGDERIVSYRCDNPTDQIYLMGNRWTGYSEQSGDVLLQAFLINPDESLARKYLSATARYLKMYEQMIGPYPYSKFALVENFWESGIGMPSFTLLGKRVIRMPWILHSSYPHELLHNYWGNSVFVDMLKGNWCEGITTYMADHLLREMKGEGQQYRLGALQRFTDYVSEENDFPVSQFRSRTTKASGAIGYDKVVMLNHMLRKIYGDKDFLRAYADFYDTRRFKKSSFADICSSFQKITGDDSSWFFDQWVERRGAPKISVENVSRGEKDGKYQLSFSVVQTQKEDVFALDLPLCIYLKGTSEVLRSKVSLSKRSHDFVMEFDSRPLRVSFDAHFDVMRRLDPHEVPDKLSGLMGADSCSIILPSSDVNVTAYRAMAELYRKRQMRMGKNVVILGDDKLSSLPEKGYVWVLGDKNKFAHEASMPGELIDNIGIPGQKLMEESAQQGSLFYIFSRDEQHVAFLSSLYPGALSSLLMKMGHYGNYSYLGFQGEKGRNTLKGTSPVLHSPMVYEFEKDLDFSQYTEPDAKSLILSRP